jgi:hypothetical protein
VLDVERAMRPPGNTAIGAECLQHSSLLLIHLCSVQYSCVVWFSCSVAGLEPFSVHVTPGWPCHMGIQLGEGALLLPDASGATALLATVENGQPLDT